MTALALIDGGELPVYPISAEDRLDSHFFLQWNLKRWRSSEFRKTVDPEAGWYGLQLFFISQDETPIGTLSCDDEQIAFDLHIPLEHWRVLCARKPSPLHNWSQVQCDNGEVRLAHPVVTLVALEALNSKKRNAAKNADDRMRKRLNTIARVLSDKMGQHSAAKNDDIINQLSDWIEKVYPGGSATERRVKEAWDALSKPR